MKILCGVAMAAALALPNMLLAAEPADRPAPEYCQVLNRAGFGVMPWEERIGGCAGGRLWPDERSGAKVTSYVYRKPNSGNQLQLVSLVIRPNGESVAERRKALAAASAVAADALTGEAERVRQAVLSKREVTFKMGGWKVVADAHDPDLMVVTFWSQKFLDDDCAELRRSHPKTKCD